VGARCCGIRGAGDVRELQNLIEAAARMIRVLPILSGCTLVAHIVSRVLIAFAASTLTLFTH